ncbi:hypothetical protein GOODEAATRI_007271 [Goodea atripinnis]|uniref:Uncharacterized protein n=1 Tax=Goodea atripinnis TaxID=208336 RepID=A0ABV0MGU5_9TELE
MLKTVLPQDQVLWLLLLHEDPEVRTVTAYQISPRTTRAMARSKQLDTFENALFYNNDWESADEELPGVDILPISYQQFKYPAFCYNCNSVDYLHQCQLICYRLQPPLPPVNSAKMNQQHTQAPTTQPFCQ